MITVVKVGGASLGRIELPDGPTVVVHGAGPQISQEMQARGIVPMFVGGRRVTTPEALPVIRAAFLAENRALCAQIGPRAVGLMGDDLGLVGERIDELGEAGTLLPLVPSWLWQLLTSDVVPVIAPLARGPLNVNADDAAAVLAVALRADRLVFVTDVPGVLVDGHVVPRLSEGDIGSLGDVLTGGIRPKLQAALLAAREGVRVDVGATAVTA